MRDTILVKNNMYFYLKKIKDIVHEKNDFAEI